MLAWSEAFCFYWYRAKPVTEMKRKQIEVELHFEFFHVLALRERMFAQWKTYGILNLYDCKGYKRYEVTIWHKQFRKGAGHAESPVGTEY